MSIIDTTVPVTETGFGGLHGLIGSAAGRRSLAPVFKPRSSYIRRVFRLSLRLITFGGRSAHLAYLVHKSSRNRANVVLQTDFRQLLKRTSSNLCAAVPMYTCPTRESQNVVITPVAKVVNKLLSPFSQDS